MFQPANAGVKMNKSGVSPMESTYSVNEIEPTAFLQIKLEPTDDNEAADSHNGIFEDFNNESAGESEENSAYEITEWNGIQRVVNVERINDRTNRTISQETCDAEDVTDQPLNALAWGSHNRHLANGFWTYFEQNFETDFELCANSKQGGEHVVKVHHLVLSIFCPSLKDATNKRLRLDIDEEDLNVLVEFLYHGKIKLRDDQLENVMNAAHSLGFSVLSEILSNFVGVGESTEQLKEIKEAVKTANPQKSPGDDEDDVDKSIGEEIGEETTLKCEMCSFTCKTLDVLKCHKQNCEESTRTQSCKLRFQLQMEHSKHGRRVTCNVCGGNFSSNTIDVHKRLHLGGKRFKCHLCPSASQRRTNLKTHLVRMHSMTPQTAGDVIEKNYPAFLLMQERRGVLKSNSAPNLVKHKRLQLSGDRPFKCHLCPIACKLSSNFETHLMHMHNMTLQEVHDLIQRMMMQKNVTTDHDSSIVDVEDGNKRLADVGEKKRFKCHMCPRVSQKRSNFKIHLMHMHDMTQEDVNDLIKRKFPYSKDSKERPVVKKGGSAICGGNSDAESLEVSSDPMAVHQKWVDYFML